MVRQPVGKVVHLVLIIAAVAVIAFGVDVAHAEVPIKSFTVVPSTTQAGGHPDIQLAFFLNNRIRREQNSICDCEDPKDIKVSLPTGLIGNPHATPRCTAAEFAGHNCAPDAQVGIAAVEVQLVKVEGDEDVILTRFITPIFNLVPRPGEPVLTGFKTPYDSAIYTVLRARTDSDYGLDAVSTATNRIIPLNSVKQIFWGVPADPIHDPLRFLVNGVKQSATDIALPGQQILCDVDGATPSTSDPATVRTKCRGGRVPQASNSPRTPFLQNPTTCGTPLTTTLDILAYDHGVTHAESAYPATTGCDQLTFNPSLSGKPTTTQADSASGIDIVLTVPQFESPDAPSPSEIRATTLTLPKGFSFNPNAADGKRACTDEQARFGTLDEAQCPEYSKIGTLEIESAVLPAPLPGAVYIGEPMPGARYRIFLTADGFGEHVKLPGIAVPDPTTGQLVISFKNLPQTPFEKFNLHIFGSERGSLATPTHCGSYPVVTHYEPWAAVLPDQSSTQFFKIDSGPNGAPCPDAQRPFAPTFSAASVGNTAGAHTPFVVGLGRSDGDQNLAGLTVTTPPGFSGTLKGLSYCPEQAIGRFADSTYSGLIEQSLPVCPVTSQIGTLIAGAGAGTRPLYVPGKVYLAGPYKGSPLSLVFVIPAVSGPFDLGNLAVRAAVGVDPTTAQITTVSDPLPQILEGIPLRTRSLQIKLDRPGFTLNPTNCSTFSIEARASGAEGAHIGLNSPFQAANCSILPYAPRLSLRLTGGINRRGHPAIHAMLRAEPGEANSRRVSVTLPKGELLDNAHIGNICTRARFAADACPKSSVLGSAEATTPLLDQPLKGLVYLRSSSNKLPDLAIDLQGQVDFTLVARINSVDARLRTTFETVPDVPVSSFALNLKGGDRGLLQNTESLCGRSKNATVAMTGQNGATHNTKTEIQVSCRAKKVSKPPVREERPGR